MTEPIPNKYHHSKIYRIVAITADGVIQPKIYIGSSVQKYLSRRLAQHRDTHRLWRIGTLHKKCKSIDIFEEYGIDNCKIQLICDYKCENKEQLQKRELEIIKATEGCINNHTSVYEKTEEGNAERQQKLQSYKKAYREKNKQRISAYMKNYHKNKKDKQNISI